MDQLENWQLVLYKKALEEVGVYEWINGSNPRIVEYHSYTSLKADDDAIPWCSSFVNWVCAICLFKRTNSAAARSWLNWGQEVTEPVKGDLVILQRGTSKTSGHVGFYVEPHQIDNNKIVVYGGNQGDKVCYSTFLRSSVLGYRRARHSDVLSLTSSQSFQ